jgi:hypothetical protein
MRKNKIHRADVMASQNTACPSCGYSITPAEILRVSTESAPSQHRGDEMPEMWYRVRGGEDCGARAVTEILFVPSFVDRAQVVMQPEAAQ